MPLLHLVQIYDNIYALSLSYKNLANISWYTTRLRSKDSKRSTGWRNKLKSHLISSLWQHAATDDAKLNDTDPSLAINQAFSSSSKIDPIIWVDKLFQAVYGELRPYSLRAFFFSLSCARYLSRLSSLCRFFESCSSLILSASSAFFFSPSLSLRFFICKMHLKRWETYTSYPNRYKLDWQ